MFRKLKLNSSINRLIEEKLYEIVADEMDKNEIRKGLWAKALTQSGGDDAKVKGKYISLRVKSLRDEENLVDSILNEIESPKIIPIEPKKEPASSEKQSLTHTRREEAVISENVSWSDCSKSDESTTESKDDFFLPNWMLGVIIFIFVIAILIK